MKTKIAIACQGGGSQTAFTAGVLKALCEAHLQDEFDFVSISGTSGGALCPNGKEGWLEGRSSTGPIRSNSEPAKILS